MVHILLGRVSENIGVGKGNQDAPVEVGNTIQPKREEPPDEEEAAHGREADDDRDEAREIAGVDATIKSVDAEIEVDAGIEL